MALIVEDGTGLANADSYVSVAAFKAYADAHGSDYSAFTDLQIEQAARRASQFIDTYRGRFPGYRVHRRAQGLEWPRYGAYVELAESGTLDHLPYRGTIYDPGYDYVASTAVPVEIVNATCEAIIRELASPGSMQPDLERGGRIQSLRAGSVEVVYAANADANTTSQIIEGILASLLTSGSGDGLFGTARRG
jgi:hypothetical protein